jgi:ribosomal protein L40E
MNLKNKLLILILFICNINYAQDWIKTDITDFSSINFPIASELTETPREIVYTANDEFAFYIVSLRKLTDQQSSLITKEEIPDLYQGFANGAIDAVNGEIISKNNITILGIPALELEYYAPDNPQLPSQRFKRIIYVNQNVISIDFWPLTKEKDVVNEKKIKFFNSFLINSNKAENSVKVTNENNSNKTNLASERGLIVGQAIFYLFLFAILIGLFLLIRYLLKKTKNKNPTSRSVEEIKTKSEKTICKKCNSENNPNTKYCTRCGFELPKN